MSLDGVERSTALAPRWLVDPDRLAPRKGTRPLPGGDEVLIRSGSFAMSARWQRPPRSAGAVVIAGRDGDDVAATASRLARAGLAVLVPDLLRRHERLDPRRRDDMEFLSQRLRMAIRFAAEELGAASPSIVACGLGEVADAAIIAAGIEKSLAGVVVVDPALALPGAYLARVGLPVLMITDAESIATPRMRRAIAELRRGKIELVGAVGGVGRSLEVASRIAGWVAALAGRH